MYSLNTALVETNFSNDVYIQEKVCGISLYTKLILYTETETHDSVELGRYNVQCHIEAFSLNAFFLSAASSASLFFFSCSSLISASNLAPLDCCTCGDMVLGFLLVETLLLMLHNPVYSGTSE